MASNSHFVVQSPPANTFVFIFTIKRRSRDSGLLQFYLLFCKRRTQVTKRVLGNSSFPGSSGFTVCQILQSQYCFIQFDKLTQIAAQCQRMSMHEAMNGYTSLFSGSNRRGEICGPVKTSPPTKISAPRLICNRICDGGLIWTKFYGSIF